MSLIVPAIIDPYKASDRSAQTTSTAGLTPVPNLPFATARTDVGALRGWVFNQNCLGRPTTACIGVHGTRWHILVIGDSHAMAIAPAFAKLAQQRQVTFSMAASGGCPWQRNLYVAPDGVAADQVYTQRCHAFKHDLYERVIPALKPDVIVAWSNDYLTRSKGLVEDASGNAMPSQGPDELRRQVKSDTERSVEELERYATKVLIAEPIPTAPGGMDPFQCLTKSSSLEACRFVADPNPSPLDLVYREVTDNSRVYEASFAKLVCPFMPICDPVIGGMIVRFDNQHITPRYAVSLAESMTSFLQRNQLMPG